MSKSITSTRPFLRYFFATACALCVVSSSFAKPTPGKLVKFKGDHKGTFTFVTQGSLFGDFGGSGPGTAIFTTKKKDSLGTLTISASDASQPGVTYSTTLKFGANGKCTALSIVPGFSDASGKGTWSVGGRKITYQLTGSDGNGSYVVNGTVTRAGKKLSVVGDFTITGSFPGAPTGGTYTFK